MKASHQIPTIDPPEWSPRLEGGRVRVVKPIPETGEVIDMAVPASRFKRDADVPDPPAAPKKPTPPVGSVGWIAVQWADYEQEKLDHSEANKRYREESKDWWKHFANKLTRAERLGLARGKIVAVLRPFEPAWEKGDKLEIASKVTARIEVVTEIEDGYRTAVILEDFRSFYLKTIVGGSSKPKSDEHGFGIPVDAGTEEFARFDGAYTQTGDVLDGGDVLEDKLYRRLHQEAAMASAMAQSKQRVRANRMQLEHRLNEARKKHRRSTARYLQRQLDSLSEKEKGKAA